jgi:hypothetical protein
MPGESYRRVSGIAYLTPHFYGKFKAGGRSLEFYENIFNYSSYFFLKIKQMTLMSFAEA